MHGINLFLYILLSILVSFHWPLVGEVLCNPDNCLVSHLMYHCDYIWDVCDGANVFLRLVDVFDFGYNK